MADKEQKYEELVAQAKALSEAENDEIALMANVAAIIHGTFHFWWTGFYRVVGEELVLGPFQGPLACTRIKFGRGVCGTAWKERRTVIVPDVEQFPGAVLREAKLSCRCSATVKCLLFSTSTAKNSALLTKPTGYFLKK